MPESRPSSAPVEGDRAIEVCRTCGEPFVVPVDILGVVAHWRYTVALSCMNCGWAGVQVHDEPALERLDRALDAHTVQMRAAIEVLGVARELDHIDRFARALTEDGILPEDF
jgi:hypothetical protein